MDRGWVYRCHCLGAAAGVPALKAAALLNLLVLIPAAANVAALAALAVWRLLPLGCTLVSTLLFALLTRLLLPAPACNKGAACGGRPQIRTQPGHPAFCEKLECGPERKRAKHV